MDETFRILFGRYLTDDDAADQQAKKKQFRAPDFNPDDADYDPAVRLKQRLKLLFPHLPATPGIPPKKTDHW